jgi:hypothetical protein
MYKILYAKYWYWGSEAYNFKISVGEYNALLAFDVRWKKFKLSILYLEIQLRNEIF